MARRLLWKRARAIGGTLITLALVALAAWLFAVNWRPRLADFPVQGVDVNESGGRIDWWKAKADGVQFAYIRATSGARGHDPRFDRNWLDSFTAGVPHGATHAFSLCQLAADQAGNFMSHVPRGHENLPPALELDFDSACAARPARGVVIEEVRRFLAAVEPHYGQRALLKVTRRFDAAYGVSGALSRPLWSVGAFFPPAYFDKPWTIWQASRFRRVDGAAEPLNWDVLAR